MLPWVYIGARNVRFSEDTVKSKVIKTTVGVANIFAIWLEKTQSFEKIKGSRQGDGGEWNIYQYGFETNNICVSQELTLLVLNLLKEESRRFEQIQFNAGWRPQLKDYNLLS